MIIGVPKEIKPYENRVSLTPSGVLLLTSAGHTVYLQSQAGNGSGFSDDDYLSVGAKVLPSIDAVYSASEMIVKVKEPLEQEYELIKKDQLLFTYFHFASHEKLTRAMMGSRAVCLAYETVSVGKTLPLLVPMSEIAGRMAVQEGAKYLESAMGGKGILLGGVPGVLPAKVLILGAGVAGTQAAKIAAGLGARVTLMDISLDRLRYLDDVLPPNVNTVYCNKYNISEEIKVSDLIIGTVLVPGARAPKLITRDMLKSMKKGTVIIDVAVDQGGCIETTKPTTHLAPIYVIDDIVHYGVANMPGAVPYTSTTALTNSTIPYVLDLANKGWKKACKENTSLKEGLNIVDGKIVYKNVADAFDLEYNHADLLL